MTETFDTRRKRLLFRSCHRGTKEIDLLVGSFAERHLADFSATELDRYEVLLDNDDGDLFAWITGRAPPPPEYDDEILRRLRNFRYTARPA
ncbi:MAG TPA: succinate dehydrogenase assembly factor 2 [Stellaceae bacterium]|jgi:antitoxin CptB|nr:succinate dehydrogenase assembly factor 2 [Stellaceae bacterium]